MRSHVIGAVMARIKHKQHGNKFREAKDSYPLYATPVRNRSKRRHWVVLIVILLALISSFALIGSYSRAKKDSEDQKTNRKSEDRLTSAVVAETKHVSPITIPTVQELLTSPETLAKCDIAVMNLLCAQGLPGSQDLDIQKCLRLLDQWSEHTRRETVKYLPYFYRDPKRGDNSEAKYRMLIIAAVLVEDMKCDYNMDLLTSGIMDNEQSTTFFRDSRDVFIHGLLTHRRQGTCSSMPVLLTAMAQRLGYPVKLSTAKGHLIAIWNDGKERFNIGYAGKGITFDSDDFYKKWPKPISDEEYKSGLYLKPFSNNEALAIFLSIRAMCSLEHRNFEEAMASARYAVGLSPMDTWMQGLLCDIRKQYHEMCAQQTQETLAQAAAALQANGQEADARMILYGPQPHGMQTPSMPGMPQRNVGYHSMPVPSQPGYRRHGVGDMR